MGRGPSSSLLLLLTSLGLGSTARPPGRTVSTSLSLLLLIGFTSSGRPPGATEEHTIRYNGDVNIGQCLTFSLPFIAVEELIFTTWTSRVVAAREPSLPTCPQVKT